MMDVCKKQPDKIKEQLDQHLYWNTKTKMAVCRLNCPCLSHHNQYYRALATSQSGLPGALYILTPLRPPSTVLAGLIALMEPLTVLPSASDHQPQVTCSRWWRRYVVVNLLMWKPDSGLIIILSPVSACTEHMLARLCWQSAHFYALCSLKGCNDSHHTMSLRGHCPMVLTHPHKHTHMHTYTERRLYVHIPIARMNEEKINSLETVTWNVWLQAEKGTLQWA